jgi:hypothetical protein
MEKKYDLEKIVKMRERLEKKLEELEGEIDEAKYLITILDKIIEGESFKPAAEIISEEKPKRRERFFAWSGKDYAWIELYENRVLLDISPEFNLPIEHKLVNYLKRELDKYFEEDLKLEEEGKIDPRKRFIYTLDEKGGKLTQVEFIDYGNEDRRRDLLGKIRWVLRTYAKENL